MKSIFKSLINQLNAIPSTQFYIQNLNKFDSFYNFIVKNAIDKLIELFK